MQPDRAERLSQSLQTALKMGDGPTVLGATR
jgi:hypothetical protein